MVLVLGKRFSFVGGAGAVLVVRNSKGRHFSEANGYSNQDSKESLTTSNLALIIVTES